MDTNLEREHCQICGEGYDDVYRVTDELWDKVTKKNLLCMECFILEAKTKGIYIFWEGDAEEYPSAAVRNEWQRNIVQKHIDELAALRSLKEGEN